MSVSTVDLASIPHTSASALLTNGSARTSVNDEYGHISISPAGRVRRASMRSLDEDDAELAETKEELNLGNGSL